MEVVEELKDQLVLHDKGQVIKLSKNVESTPKKGVLVGQQDKTAEAKRVAAEYLKQVYGEETKR